MCAARSDEPPTDRAAVVASEGPSRLGRLRRVTTEGVTDVIDRTERRWPPTAMATNLVRRYRRIGGTVIAGNLAFRFFIWLLPTFLLVIAIASVSARSGVDVKAVGEDQLQLGGSLADALATSAEQTQSSGLQAGLTALVAMLYASSVLVSALHAAAVLGWDLPPETPKRRVTITARLVGALTLIAGVIALNVALRNSGPLLGVFSHVLSFTAVLAVLVGLFVSLPRRSTEWYWNLPGAVVGAASYVALQAYAVIWLPRTIESKSTTYGTIGIAASTLGYLFLIGTIIVVATLVNVVWWEYFGSKRHNSSPG